MRDKSKRYEVIVDDSAKEALEKHVEFLAQVSHSAAVRLVDDIEKGFESLEFMPARCPLFIAGKTGDTYRRLIVAGRYQLVFTFNEEEGIVDIRYILDSRQDSTI